jgi:outer membrane protein OmpA-like peptidoglycan-associated protein
MRKLTLLATTLLVAAPLAAPRAAAETVTGPYVSLGAGYNILQDQYLHTDPAISGIPSGGYYYNGNYHQNGDNSTRFRYGNGFDGAAAVGWGLGNGIRLEVQGAYLYSDVDKRAGSPVPGSSNGHSESYGGYGNVYYDFDLPAWGIDLGGITPYIGGGAGYLWTHLSPLTTNNADGTLDRVGGTKGGFAFQGIVGAAYPLDMVMPGLDLTVEYRYQQELTKGYYGGTHYQPFGVNRGYVGLSNPQDHSIMLGVRYALWQPAPPPPPAPPAPPPAPAVQAARTYLVFFDWDRADLSARARQIVAEAAQASTHVQNTRLEVNGYTDLSGTAAYNQKLSVRRAQSVEAELVRDGVAENEITIHGYGESNPLVPTAKGVREPQNRRVEIILQ